MCKIHFLLFFFFFPFFFLLSKTPWISSSHIGLKVQDFLTYNHIWKWFFGCSSSWSSCTKKISYTVIRQDHENCNRENHWKGDSWGTHSSPKEFWNLARHMLPDPHTPGSGHLPQLGCDSASWECCFSLLLSAALWEWYPSPLFFIVLGCVLRDVIPYL